MRHPSTAITPTIAASVFETQLRRNSELYVPEEVFGRTLIKTAEILAPLVKRKH